MQGLFVAAKQGFQYLWVHHKMLVFEESEWIGKGCFGVLLYSSWTANNSSNWPIEWSSLTWMVFLIDHSRVRWPTLGHTNTWDWTSPRLPLRANPMQLPIALPSMTPDKSNRVRTSVSLVPGFMTSLISTLQHKRMEETLGVFFFACSMLAQSRRKQKT